MDWNVTLRVIWKVVSTRRELENLEMTKGIMSFRKKTDENW